MRRVTGRWSQAMLAIAAGAVALLAAGPVAARPPEDASFTDHGVDSLICGFPLEADLRADAHLRFVPGAGAPHDLLFPTTLNIRLQNLLTGASTTLRDAEPTRFASDGGSFTFAGNVLVTTGPFPFVRMRGAATISLVDFLFTRFRGSQEVVDICGSVEPSARDGTPRVTPPPWDAGSNPLAAMKRAGVVPGVFALAEHIHAHLDVFVNGQAVSVAPGIGVVAPVDAGGQNIHSAWDKMAPVHTHGPDGILHVHTHIPELFTLGDFFDVWRVRLTERCLGSQCDGTRAYVNGSLVAGSPRDIVIRPRDEIAVVVGQPPASIPSSYVFPPGLEDFGFPG